MLNTLPEERILVLAPRGRDAAVIEQVLSEGRFSCALCSTHQQLTQELALGAGAALIAEEALLDSDLTPLADWLSLQASWSDFPFILLVSRQPLQRAAAARSLLENLGNLILLERPLNAATLRRATASALRARKRQYQARGDLLERARAEERLLMALQAGHLGAWELELSNWTLHASATTKANFGRAPAEPLTYEDVIASVHPDDQDRRRTLVLAAIAAVSDFDIEYRVIWPDGSLHWVRVQGKTNADADGQPFLMAGVTQDVTERRESERRLHQSQEALRQLNETLESRIGERTAELAQANDRLMREITERERTQMALVQSQKMEAVGRLTGGIAHDFNNLLNVILGNIELIDMYSTDERIKRLASVARKSTNRGAKLTGQLLAFARNQSLDLRPVDLAQVLESAKDLLSASLGSNIDIRFEVRPDMPRVKADANQLELAVLNLAINARDAMPRGGTLTICGDSRPSPDNTLPEGDYGVITVSDTGEGINPEILTKVFEPFFTTKPLGQGTGLGLSQVYGIAQQSGGTARIESVVGSGTKVEIWLPCADPVCEPERSAASDAMNARNNSDTKILVVEDDPGVRQFIVECLGILGYRVVQADCGEAGLAQLDAERPDLLIADFLMPGMTGAEMVAKAIEKFPGLRVIIATGYADMHAVENVVGRNAILRKPFQIHDLAHSVRTALAR